MNESKVDDTIIEKLLGKANKRPAPSAQATVSARNDFMQVWEQEYAGQASTEPGPAKASNDERPRSSWQLPASIAAAVLLATFVGLFMRDAGIKPAANTAALVAAAIESRVGTVSVDGLALDTDDAQLLVGADVETAADSYLRVRLANNASLRMDKASRITLADGSIRLLTGRVYIDAPGTSESVSVYVNGYAIEDIGTQYEVRAFAGGVDVGVREGEVLIKSGDSDDVLARATAFVGDGAMVEVRDAGAKERRISSTDPHWDWIHKMPVDYQLSNVDDFVTLVARETGLQLEYSSPIVASSSRNTRLSGKIQVDANLSQRVDDILEAASFIRRQSSEQVLLIDFQRP